jgi:hypothetical protein
VSSNAAPSLDITLTILRAAAEETRLRILALLADGELSAEDITDPDGRSLGGGQLLADSGCRAVRADGSVHPRRFLLGPSVSGSAGSAGFSRPGFNGAGFRQNDAVARQILRLLYHQVTTGPSSPPQQIHRSKELHHAR